MSSIYPGSSLPEKLRDRAILNLGCGHQHIEGAINLDLTDRTKPDVVHDLNQFPWPLPDNHFSEVLAFDVLEHLGDLLGVFEEIHRVCRNGAVVKIAAPHFSCANAYTDPTHRHFFGRFSLDCFRGEDVRGFYTEARFRERHCGIIFFPTLANKIVARLANRFPMAYELRWAWIFPAWFLSFELEVIKTAAGDVSPASS